MSIVDPELMLSVPPKLDGPTRFDALFHAVEGYMATIASPMGDMFALQAIEYIAKYLPRRREQRGRSGSARLRRPGQYLFRLCGDHFLLYVGTLH